MKEHLATVARHIVALGPHAGAHRLALRAAACLAVPLAVLVAFDRIDLSIYATFGAFAGIYGRDDGYASRLRMQASAGLMLVVAMLLGTTLAVTEAPEILSVAVVAVVGSLVTVLADVFGWRPPGGLFAVFSSGACASIPATAMSLTFVLACGGGAVLWCLILTAGLARIRGNSWRSLLVSPSEPRTPVSRPVGWTTVIAVGIAGFIAGLAGLILVGGHWYWANVAAVAALSGPTAYARLARGIQRLVGTLIGVVLAAGILAVEPPPLAVIGLAIFCQGVIELLVMRNYAIAVLFITVIALLMVHLADPAPVRTLLTDRVFDTLIGVVVGGILVLVLAARGSWRLRRHRA